MAGSDVCHDKARPDSAASASITAAGAAESSEVTTSIESSNRSFRDVQTLRMFVERGTAGCAQRIRGDFQRVERPLLNGAEVALKRHAQVAHAVEHLIHVLFTTMEVFVHAISAELIPFFYFGKQAFHVNAGLFSQLFKGIRFNRANRHAVGQVADEVVNGKAVDFIDEALIENFIGGRLLLPYGAKVSYSPN